MPSISMCVLTESDKEAESYAQTKSKIALYTRFSHPLRARLNLYAFFPHLKKIKFLLLNMFVPSSFSYHSNIWFPNNRLYYSSLKYDKEICRNRYFNLFDFFARQKFQPRLFGFFA